MKKDKDKNLEANQVKLLYTSKMVAIGEMAAGIAHEINNPLAVISASTKMLKKAKELNKLDDAMFDEIINDIDTTILRLTRIVNGLRTVSRDCEKTIIEPVIVRDVFEDVLGLCSEKFKNHGIKLQVDLDAPAFSNWVMADRVQLSQVLVNLLGNAYDAIEKLDEKWIRVESEEEHNSQFIRVIDSGGGIAPEVQAKMFDPFFTTKEVGRGTGLGLSISKNIMTQMGGDLLVDNSYANTCFRIDLKKGTPQALKVS